MLFVFKKIITSCYAAAVATCKDIAFCADPVTKVFNRRVGVYIPLASYLLFGWQILPSIIFTFFAAIPASLKFRDFYVEELAKDHVIKISLKNKQLIDTYFKKIDNKKSVDRKFLTECEETGRLEQLIQEIYEPKAKLENKLGNGFFYEVTQENSNAILYLLGALHAERFKNLPKYLQQKIEDLLKNPNISIYNEIKTEPAPDIKTLKGKFNLLKVVLEIMLRYYSFSSLTTGLMYPWFATEPALSPEMCYLLLKYRKQESFLSLLTFDLVKQNIIIRSTMKKIIEPNALLQENPLLSILLLQGNGLDNTIIKKRCLYGLSNLCLETVGTRNAFKKAAELAVPSYTQKQEQATLALIWNVFAGEINFNTDEKYAAENYGEEALKVVGDLFTSYRESDNIEVVLKHLGFESNVLSDTTEKRYMQLKIEKPHLYALLIYLKKASLNLPESTPDNSKVILEAINTETDAREIIRQIVWLKEFLRLFKIKQSAFACFGLAHMAGENNILELLALHDCKIHKVTATEKIDVTEKFRPTHTEVKLHKSFGLPFYAISSDRQKTLSERCCGEKPPSVGKVINLTPKISVMI